MLHTKKTRRKRIQQKERQKSMRFITTQVKLYRSMFTPIFNIVSKKHKSLGYSDFSFHDVPLVLCMFCQKICTVLVMVVLN